MLICKESITSFCMYLHERECSEATVSKYLHDVEQLRLFCGGNVEDKSTLISFKQDLQKRGYAASSVNSMLTAVNYFLAYIGRTEWKL